MSRAYIQDIQKLPHDVTIECCDGSYQCIGLLLSIRSEYMRTCLEGNFAENIKVLKFPTKKLAIMKKITNWIQWDSLPVAKIYNLTNLLETYAYADEFLLSNYVYLLGKIIKRTLEYIDCAYIVYNWCNERGLFEEFKNTAWETIIAFLDKGKSIHYSCELCGTKYNSQMQECCEEYPSQMAPEFLQKYSSDRILDPNWISPATQFDIMKRFLQHRLNVL